MGGPNSGGRIAAIWYRQSGREEYDGSSMSTRQVDVTDPGARQHTITGLNDSADCIVLLIVYKGTGIGVASDEVKGTPQAHRAIASNWVKTS